MSLNTAPSMSTFSLCINFGSLYKADSCWSTKISSKTQHNNTSISKCICIMNFALLFCFFNLTSYENIELNLQNSSHIKYLCKIKCDPLLNVHAESTSVTKYKKYISPCTKNTSHKVQKIHNTKKILSKFFN